MNDAPPPAFRKPQPAAQQYAADGLAEPLAQGGALLTERILALAREHGIPTQDEATLARLVEHLPKDSAVSAESYRVIAEIVSFLFNADCDFKKSNG